ncbi:hypothetical protein JZ751_006622 [Albula glossodonta]|uniref:Matrin-3 n=1 Tax=Albula glossodonta TaxID=121402 RepID=A0A8T2P4W3_9TELE|nr:hypothetical protein JZ751_006622 [Albula glossodonta]
MGSSGGQASTRGQQMDYGYGSMQEGPTHGYKRMEYGDNSSGGLSRDRQYSELSRDRYGGLGMGPSLASDSGFLQKRMGSPSQGKVQDFLGAMPHMFPHVCSLCDFDVHSTMEWTQHTNGLRHVENRRLLLQMYPEWDPHLAANRASGSIGFDTTNRSDGILGPAPVGLPRGGMTSTWGAGVSNQKHPLSVTPKVRSRVVVAKFERNILSLNAFLDLARPFGTVCQHLVLNNKAFLEMQNHEEALAMVNFYQRKPPVMQGKEIKIYLSHDLITIEKRTRERDSKVQQSQVVYFSNLPREREKKSELLTVARRFGTVEKYLFLNDEAFVQLGTPEDAEMLVKYYSLHPLTIKGRSIQLNICAKYKTLTVNPPRNAPGRERERQDRKDSRGSRKGSPKRQRSGSTGERSSKGKEESSRKEEEREVEDSAALEEEGSGDEVTGVMEAEETEEGVGGEGGDVQEAGQTEAVEEEEEPSSLAEQAVPESDLTEHTEEASEVPPTEGSKGAAAEEPPAQTETSQAEGEIPLEDTKEAEPSAEPAESSEIPNEELEDDQEEFMEQDLPENMEDFVTLDELAEEEDADGAATQSGSDSQSERSRNNGQGRRVVNVVGFKRGHNFLEEILNLAKPFGKVVRHLVLDTRPEAFLELASEEEARSMVAFYSANITPVVCGKAVKIHHSQAYATIRSGQVLYIGQIPPFKGSDASFLKIAEPFGKVRRYFLNRSRNECFIEMESRDDTDRMANAYRENPPKFEGKRLTVYVSRKYKQLKYGLRPPPPEPEQDRPSKRERSGAEEDSRSAPPAKIKVKKEEEPPAKKTCIREEKSSPEESSSSREEQKAAEEEPSSNGVNQLQQDEMEKGSTEPPSGQEELALKTENEEVKITKPSESEDTQKKGTEGGCGSEGAVVPPCSGATEKSSESEETPNAKPQAEKKPPSTPVPLGPYQPNNPVGVEFVKMGYYCRVCFLFYSNEETAKKVHCSSLSHYQKLQKHLDKEKEKGEKKTKSQ